MGSEGIASQTDISTTASDGNGPANAWLKMTTDMIKPDLASRADIGDSATAIRAAHQMLAELLDVPSLSPRVVSGLQQVSGLLRLAEGRQSQPPKSKRQRCSLPQDYVRHRSSWSTTTAATGLPTDEPPLSQYRQINIRSQHGGRLSLASTSSHSLAMANGHADLAARMPKSHSFSDARSDAILGSLASRRFTTFGRMSLVNSALTEVRHEAGDDSQLSDDVSSTGDASSTGEPRDSLTDGSFVNTLRDNIMESWSRRTSESPGVVPPQSVADHSAGARHGLHMTDSGRLQFTISETDSCALLTSEAVSQWDYPIFTLAELYPDSTLSLMAYKLFAEINLIDSFRIPAQEFINFFHALEMGYHDNPYHNRTHAADVMHGVYYMMTQPVPGFSQMAPDSKLLQPGPEGEHPDRHVFTAADSYGIIGGNLPALELMALFTAAAMHDYDHPGRTNAFLVTAQAPLAVLYNDRSVLESHHAASAWHLYLSDARFDWLVNLEPGEFKRLRYLVIELILATDLKRHFELVAEFNTKVNDVDATGIDWMSERDRLMVSNMVIKMADISGPTKPKHLHVNWTTRIAEEFYEQGDDEARLGLSISPFMDRKEPHLARLQESFITHLVKPLCTALSTAQLLPGVWTEDENECNHDEAEGERRKIVCPLVVCLEANYEYWKNNDKNGESDNL